MYIYICVCVCVYIYICVCVCVYVCMYLYIYIYSTVENHNCKTLVFDHQLCFVFNSVTLPEGHAIQLQGNEIKLPRRPHTISITQSCTHTHREYQN